MKIFNSLGSNYNFIFALKTFFSFGSKNDNVKLTKYLEEKYGGKAILLYKGREAIKLALEMVGQEGSYVAVNGFTCLAVSQAIIDSGYKTQYLDIEKDNLNFSSETLKETIDKNPSIKVVMVQNTLGNSCEISQIKELCHKKDLILIEDLAHSVGTKYQNNEEVGKIGDFIVLSFGQDKMIDSVSGGALVVRSEKYLDFNKINSYKGINFGRNLRDKIYPFLTFKIRFGYSLSLGKYFHKLFQLLKLFNNPILFENDYHYLNGWYSKTTIDRFRKLKKNLSHRVEVVKCYSDGLDERITLKLKTTNSNLPLLRYPIIVKNRENLIKYLQKKGFFINDIWYDAPIAPKKYLYLSNYQKGECPVAEELADEIINLPTHINISVKKARRLVELINKWWATNEI